MASAIFSGIRPPASRMGYLVAARFAMFQSARRPAPPNVFDFVSEVAASRRNEDAELCSRNRENWNFDSVRNALMTGKWCAHCVLMAVDSSPWSWTALRRRDFASAIIDAESQLTKTPTVETSAGSLRRIFQASAGARQRGLFS